MTTYEELQAQAQAEAAMTEADQKWVEVLLKRARLCDAVAIAARNGVTLPATVLEPLRECDAAIAAWTAAIFKSDDLERQLSDAAKAQADR